MANADWMSNLPPGIDNIPIINLAIPGTHNSMTYGINRKSTAAADADNLMRRLYKIVPCIVRRWAKTQSQSVTAQLELGVRFFDLRIVAEDGKYYYAHGLRAMEWEQPLVELVKFLDSHPAEFVILDFQHFYNMTDEFHVDLQDKLLSLFGKRLWLPGDGSLNECTLNNARKLKKQILIIYRRCPKDVKNKFWDSSNWSTPWPNMVSCKKLEDYLEMNLLTRNVNKGHVSQCIITPDARYICFRLTSSLRRTGKTVLRELSPWIQKQTPGSAQKTVNVILADFVDIKNGRICQTIIDLNKKIVITGTSNTGTAGATNKGTK